MKHSLLIVGMVSILLAAGVVPSISGSIKDQGYYQLSRGTDVKIDPDPTMVVQNEISLELIPGSPGQPSLLVAAYNDYPYVGGPGLGFSRSTDGGATWTATQLGYPMNPYTGVQMDDMFDPTVTIDTQGNVFVGQISSDSFWYSGMCVHKSSDGGVTFLPPVTVALDLPPGPAPDPNFRFNDRCQITADISSSSPYTDNVYIAWIKDRGFGMPLPYSDIYFSFSTNNGVTFSTPVTINEIQHDMANMPVPAVASDGTIYVSWMDYNVWTGGIGSIYLDKSTDGGVTWGADQLVTPVNLPPLTLTTNTGLTDVVSKGAPVLKVSASNPQELYITYAADPDGVGLDEASILFIKSTDGGVTWSPPVIVNHDEATTNDQHLPWMDVKPDGTIDIVWYDRRNDPFDKLWDVYMARSTNGGITWSTNVRINDQLFASPTNPWGVPWMGEYMGLAVDSSHAYIVFTSSVTDGFGDVYFDKIDNANLPLPVPDLDCVGDLHFGNVKSGSTVTGDFLVKNIGSLASLLDWEVESYPDWGVWMFTPSSGLDLSGGGSTMVNVTIVAPKQVAIVGLWMEPCDEEFTGQVKVVNKENSSDFCLIDVSMMVPVKHGVSPFFVLGRLLERFPHAFPLLRFLLEI
jgi:hypothetical protein